MRQDRSMDTPQAQPHKHPGAPPQAVGHPCGCGSSPQRMRIARRRLPVRRRIEPGRGITVRGRVTG